ncbi:MAG: hypothetical protein NTZ80_01040 [Patescibacteria group bacterium]|nr:hypothetical protein [Patescibacteria group bacterium]
MHPYISGIIGIIAGLAILKYRRQVKEMMGDINFAEKYLGMGGTYTIILIIGVLTVIFSIMHMFGGLGSFLGGLFGWLIPGNKK